MKLSQISFDWILKHVKVCTAIFFSYFLKILLYNKNIKILLYKKFGPPFMIFEKKGHIPKK